MLNRETFILHVMFCTLVRGDILQNIRTQSSNKHTNSAYTVSIQIFVQNNISDAGCGVQNCLNFTPYKSIPLNSVSYGCYNSMNSAFLHVGYFQ